jgi:hypothetical protein
MMVFRDRHHRNNTVMSSHPIIRSQTGSSEDIKETPSIQGARGEPDPQLGIADVLAYFQEYTK